MKGVGNEYTFDHILDTVKVNEEIAVKFTYPTLKTKTYSASGDFLLVTKLGEYTVSIRESTIAFNTVKESNPHVYEEAMCICKFLVKLLDPHVSMDPYESFKTFKWYRKAQLGCIALLIVVLGFFAVLNSDIAQFSPTLQIRQSHLSSYSTTITIGAALEDFLGDTKWSSYKIGSTQYVDCVGTATYTSTNELAYVKITFEFLGERFSVKSVTIDGVEQSGVMSNMFLEGVYDSYSS